MIRKYKINKELLPYYYDDILELVDWIPKMIKIYLPFEVKSKLGQNNEYLYFKKCREHHFEYSDYNFSPEAENFFVLDWEVELFLEKYPYFRHLFIVDPWDPQEGKEEPKKGFFKRLFSRSK